MSIRHASVGLLGVLLIAAGLVGCSLGKSLPSSTQSYSQHETTGIPRSSSPSARSHAPVLHTVAEFTLGGVATHLSLDGRWLAYAWARTGRDTPQQIRLVDLTTRATRTIAHSRWPKGQTDWVEVTNGWAFWTDESWPEDDGASMPSWQITALNIKTGNTQVLAKGSAPKPDPIPQAGNGYLAWFDIDSALKGYDLHEFDTKTQTSSVIGHLDDSYAPSLLAPANNGTYTSAAHIDPKATDESDIHSDIWFAPHHGKSLRQVTTSGKGRDPSASKQDNTVVWEIGSAGESEGLVVQTDAGQRVELRSKPYAGASNTVVGSGYFATLLDDGGLLVTEITNPKMTARIKTSGVVEVGCRFSASGALVTYCDVDPDHLDDDHVIVARVD